MEKKYIFWGAWRLEIKIILNILNFGRRESSKVQAEEEEEEIFNTILVSFMYMASEKEK